MTSLLNGQRIIKLRFKIDNPALLLSRLSDSLLANLLII